MYSQQTVADSGKRHAGQTILLEKSACRDGASYFHADPDLEAACDEFAATFFARSFAKRWERHTISAHPASPGCSLGQLVAGAAPEI
jgi:hypothetical protein